ncbi:MAG: hypothetical protein L3J69_00925 [Desulfobacula sp.]|nr:hypothetical protein [Desulfobacula sp.]
MDSFTKEIKEFAIKAGADDVGIAGKECFQRIPTVRPDQLLPQAESVIVICCRRMNARVGQYQPSWNAVEHRTAAINIIMQVLLQTSGFIEDKGYESFPIGLHGVFHGAGDAAHNAIKHLDITQEGEILGRENFEKTYWENYKCLSHMHLAEEAGLGEIGWCRGLITPRFGPRISLASIVTDAFLEPDKKLEEPVCKKEECGKCVEYCRSGALTPDYGYNATKCMMQMGEIPPAEVINRKDEKELRRYFIAQTASVGGVRIPTLDTATSRTVGSGGCGMCIVACPTGQRRQVKPLATQGKLSIGTNLM